MDDIDAKKTRTVSWFSELRNRLCAAFEDIEDSLTGTEHAMLPAGRFERKIWQRDEGGGGEISLMRGRVFEKVGVNISTVHGTFSEDFRTQIPGAGDTGVFWAAGISLVAHMRSPLIPAVHMNARFIVTSKSWFGGGADLTPMFLDTEQTKSDTGLFHQALKNACDKHHADSYEKFSKWCDEYFYLKHRDERRGVGGIFYDYLEDDWQMNFDFTQHVGNAFLDVYPRIVRAHMQKPWTTAQREHQLLRRGRYVEFNLLYDRGTMFGLKTGGNTEAILMSLPPEVKWN